ncbi:hypothetical protein BDP27DRAFT_1300961 [Rhodocollybia butyracea]|uniref:NB-ARC domain-containing protein n=1 Tax=Rhodocollybia butyracea TaxID=206335 RepID=A0A9P5PEH0_9AGAR|nr:hypothetical protein BDP27DRAFT_1300961 [Rhodocollybia butyracea]
MAGRTIDQSISNAQPPLGSVLAGASNFSIQGSNFTTVGGNMNQVINNNWITYNVPSFIHPGSNINNVLRCPPPSKDFVGREGALQSLSKLFASPVVTITCERPEMMKDIIARVKMWTGFAFVIWDARSEDGLEDGLDRWSLDTSRDTILVLENADSSLDLEFYIPYSLHTNVLILGVNKGISALASNPGCIFTLPAPMNRQAFRKFLDGVRKAFVHQQRIVPLVARGGTGKTQVARKFVSDYGKRFSNHWTIDASSEMTIIAGFKTLGNAANIGTKVQEVYQFLQNSQENWLLIFDNANHEVDLAKYIPHCNHGSILITSRDKNVYQLSSLDQPFSDLPDLTSDEAIKLLLKSAHQEDSEEIHLEIVQALGYQALAISTAGTYVSQHPTCQLKDYLKVFNEKHDTLLKYQLKTLDKYEMTILVAFQLSFDFLSVPTQSFIQMCSSFHHFGIPVEMFKQAASFTLQRVKVLPGEEELLKSIAEGLTSFLAKFPSHLDVDASVNELARMSLAEYSADNGSVSFHPVVHYCAYETIHEENLQAVALLLMAYVAPDSIVSSDDYKFQHQLFPHARHLCNSKTSLPTVFISEKLSYIFSQEGQWSVARLLQEQVMQICQAVLGEHSPDTLTSMFSLADTYLHLGRYTEAEELEKEVVQIQKTVLGEQHPNTLASVSNLASTYLRMGRYIEAEALAKEGIQISKIVLGEQHPGTLTLMSNLTLTYSCMGRYTEAEVLGEEIVQIKRTVLGEEHPSTLVSLSNLALIYFYLGRYNEAEKLGSNVTQMSKTILGEQHPDTLTSMSNLAFTYSHMGRYNDAEVLEKEVLEIRKVVLAERHPGTLKSMSNLVHTYSHMGRYNEAEELGKEVMELQKSALGKQHPDTLISISNLALIYSQLGRYDDAELLGKDVLQSYKIVLGEHHPETLTSMSNLAETYSHLGRYGDAEVLRKQELQICKAVLGAQHHDTLISMSNLALIYCHTGKYNEAEILGKEVLQTGRTALGEQHPVCLSAMSNLALTYSRMGKYNKAELLGEEVVEIHKTVLGEQHPKTLTSMSNLSLTYSRMGKYNKAEELGKKVVQMFTSVLGEQHPHTLTALNNLASTYSHMGRLPLQ